jgi:hypothetical protein
MDALKLDSNACHPTLTCSPITADAQRKLISLVPRVAILVSSELATLKGGQIIWAFSSRVSERVSQKHVRQVKRDPSIKHLYQISQKHVAKFQKNFI